MNLCASQVHEFSLMHWLNYSATQSYTVKVNNSSSNNRWRDILSARWQAPLWTATALSDWLPRTLLLQSAPLAVSRQREKKKPQARWRKDNNPFRRVITCGSQLLAVMVGDIVFLFSLFLFFFAFSFVRWARLRLCADRSDTFIQHFDGWLSAVPVLHDTLNKQTRQLSNSIKMKDFSTGFLFLIVCPHPLVRDIQLKAAWKLFHPQSRHTTVLLTMPFIVAGEQKTRYDVLWTIDVYFFVKVYLFTLCV